MRNRSPILAFAPLRRLPAPSFRGADSPNVVFFRKLGSNPLESLKTRLKKALFFGAERMSNGAERMSNGVGTAPNGDRTGVERPAGRAPRPYAIHSPPS